MSLKLSGVKWGWVALSVVLAVIVFVAVQTLISLGHGVVLGFQMRQAPPQEVLMEAFTSLPFILLGALEMALGAFVGGRLAARKSESNPQMAGLVVGVGTTVVLLVLGALQGTLDAWAVLWTIEPLSVGLSLLVVSVVKRSGGLFVAGLILCGLAGVGLIGMTSVVSAWWLPNLLGPAILILVGFLLLLSSVIRRSPAPEPAGE